MIATAAGRPNGTTFHRLAIWSVLFPDDFAPELDQLSDSAHEFGDRVRDTATDVHG